MLLHAVDSLGRCANRKGVSILETGKASADDARVAVIVASCIPMARVGPFAFVTVHPKSLVHCFLNFFTRPGTLPDPDFGQCSLQPLRIVETATSTPVFARVLVLSKHQTPTILKLYRHSYRIQILSINVQRHGLASPHVGNMVPFAISNSVLRTRLLRKVVTRSEEHDTTVFPWASIAARCQKVVAPRISLTIGDYRPTGIGGSVDFDPVLDCEAAFQSLKSAILAHLQTPLPIGTKISISTGKIDGQLICFECWAVNILRVWNHEMVVSSRLIQEVIT
mmetsp:Transcript_38290/g.59766  ORF Transcript_38290/g.59766 Transcript_38290/m.59766 type:complete len:280 (-) Transcript_38290:15-854(-)